jgi:hypothetical protein
MNLEELRAQARAVATRMEARINTALGEKRDLTAEEEAADAADAAELAELKGKITAAENDGTGADAADPVVIAVAAERARIVALADLCPSSVVATPLRTAIEQGTTAGAFAIELATASKRRGATMGQLRDGAVQAGQVPDAPGAGAKDKGKPKTGAEQATGILALAARAGVAAVAHLKQG